MADIKVKDLSTTSSITTDNKLMVLTNNTNNTVQNITVQNLLTNIVSANSNNAITQGTDNKLYVQSTSSVTGDLDNLTTANKSNLVNAINEVNGDIGDLSTLVTTAKNNTVAAINELALTVDPTLQYDAMNNSKAMETGEVSTNKTILADIIKYSESTFDSSKFIKSGSTIVDYNGIASQFSALNYLSIDTSAMAYTKSLDIIIPLELTTLNVDQWFLTNGFNANAGGFLIQITAANKLRVLIGSGNGSYDIANITGSHIYTAGKVYIRVQFDGTKYVLSYSNDKINWTVDITINSNTIAPIHNTNIILGAGSTASYQGRYDLKGFSIHIDGKPAFFGAKTGIDTLKPDDYTPLPTNDPVPVTPDGVASGFSATKYITKEFELDTSYTTCEIDLGEIEIATLSYNQWFFVAQESNNSISKGLRIMINTAGKARWLAGSGGSNWDISTPNSIIGNTVYSVGDKVKFKLVSNGLRYSLYESINGGAWQENSGVDNPSKLNFDTTIQIGSDNSSNYYRGTYDLNGIKIIKDGAVVWQPCLKIPVIYSKTGSKVVDSAYRDRVSDMYEQYGKAPYYTLSDSDFTLPMGELYGLMTTIIEEYHNGSSWYRVWSNGWCEQGDADQSEGKIYFLKEFKNTDYIFITVSNTGIGISYSDKATNSITINWGDSSTLPNEKCMWYSCGYIF